MKRSSMIGMMASNLWFWYGQQYSMVEEWEKEQILVKEIYMDEANMLLSLMEEGGMLPPSHEFKMGDTIVRDNCWEREDETK